MNIKIGSFIISKPVWIRLGLIAIVVILMIALDWLDKFIIWGLFIPTTLTEIVRQFRVDNGYADADETPEH
ncbi:hypothetical protein [Spirosoma rhododendri]|uniref:Uncharacterized protein n=1 Tax=Spirosoma rhododendri TaxID=2728024 RepID=A0A7L5DJ90_9BACT|nr:hypothetical protein [Spirosoma rhododendri]QJD77492.1 hypothetical protein HH216_02975 [Spirosoma rhododendri]